MKVYYLKTKGNTMKTITKITALALIVSGLTWGSSLKVDTEKSSLKWFATKVTGAHDGAVQLKSGELDLKENKLVGGKIIIDMNTISVRDIEDPKYNAKLKGHLESPDFFEVEKFKSAVLDIIKVEPLKDGQFQITAKLMIKGYINEVTFPAQVKWVGKQLNAQAEITIDRTLWKIKYGSANFFKGLGDKAIHDEIKFKVDLTTK